MASITFTVASTSINGSKSYTLTDAEIVRLANAYKTILGGSPTNAQALLGWADDVMTKTKQTVFRIERDAVDATVIPLNPT